MSMIERIPTTRRDPPRPCHRARAALGELAGGSRGDLAIAQRHMS